MFERIVVPERFVYGILLQSPPDRNESLEAET